MLSRSYRRVGADERREARRAAVECDVTGHPAIDDAALGWRIATTAVLLLPAMGLFAVGGDEAAAHSARSVPSYGSSGRFRRWGRRSVMSRSGRGPAWCR
jgi:hypothetical protein